MVTRTAAINAMLRAKTHKDLASLYSPAMECQVNVAKDTGDRIEGEYEGVKWNGYTDGVTVWKPFRIPRNAMHEPEYTDVEMNYDIAKHAEGIGMTGWDWQNKVSRWVAYDFDAIIGHSDKHAHKLTAEELAEIRDLACQIPWVTVRYSTSGKGLHLYVFTDTVSTQNHSEHSALARAILMKLSALTGYDFSSKVDICGGNMWVWHRKMTGTEGLKLIKQGTVLTDIPPNWRDHVNVVKGSSKKLTVPTNVEDVEKFDALNGLHTHVKLDPNHIRLIKYLNDQGMYHWWDADHHMLVTHTQHLKKAHTDLKLRGIFETVTKGTTSHNCFAYPIRNGGWSVRRYSQGVKEHPSWEQDGANWTRTFFNVQPTLRTVARAHEGIEDTNGAYVFPDFESAKKAALILGSEINLPARYTFRQTSLAMHKDGVRVVVSIAADGSDAQTEVPGWLKKGTRWQRILDGQKNETLTEIESESYEDTVRHLVTSHGDDAGWVIRSGQNWIQEPLNHVRSALEAMNLKRGDINSVVGNSVLKPWTLTSIPFEVEYPGDRVWNRNAPQFKYKPSDSDTLTYPTWSKLLKHIGQSLDMYVAEDSWCKSHGVQDGATYLKLWIASMLQFPYEPLPYLFIYGEMQETGKSSFYEALQLLFSPGVVNIVTTLTNPQGFNGELLGAILCFVEETNLSESKVAYERLKDWVTSRQFSLHVKGATPVMVKNTMHFVHCANPRSACPIFPGDTRITMVHVQQKPENPIPKAQLHQQLIKEAPDFLGSVTRLEIPLSDTRLRIPVIETADKQAAAESQRSELMEFIADNCHHTPGAVIKCSEFYALFLETVDPNQRHRWSKIRVSKEMPDWVVRGRLSNDANWHYGNITLNANEKPSGQLQAFNNFLRKVKDPVSQ